MLGLDASTFLCSSFIYRRVPTISKYVALLSLGSTVYVSFVMQLRDCLHVNSLHLSSISKTHHSAPTLHLAALLPIHYEDEGDG